MGRKLYIHSGSLKTGTTTVQTFFAENRAAIAKNEKLLYPVAGSLVPGVTRFHNNHYGLFTDYSIEVARNGEPRLRLNNGYRRERWEQVRREALRYPEHDILVSFEQFMKPRGPHRNGWDDEWVREIREIFPDYTLKFIYYVRRIDDFCLSMHNQSLKQIHTSYAPQNHPKTIYKRYMGFFAREAERAIGLFGRDNVIFRIYDRSTLKNGDILDDFCSIFPIDPWKYVSREIGISENPRIPDDCTPYVSILLDIDKERTSYVMRDAYREICEAFRNPENARKENEAEWRGELDACGRLEIEKLDSLIPGYGELFAKRDLSWDFSAPEFSAADVILHKTLFKMRRDAEDAAYCALHNSLTAANPASSHKPRLMHIPWDRAGYFKVHQSESGAFCFTPGKSAAPAAPPVFAIAATNAELRLLQAILLALGLQDAGVVAHNTEFSDCRGMNPEEAAAAANPNRVRIPYDLQTTLVLPGQFLIGHVSPATVRDALGDVKPLVLIRDLRNSLIASVYFAALASGESPERAVPTPDAILDFLRSGKNQDNIMTMRNNAQLSEFARVMRYEEILSGEPNAMAPSVAALAEAAECAADAARSAIGSALGSPLMKHALPIPFDPAACWNDDVEYEFFARGMKRDNAGMGYERDADI